jgi:hypothetical protein
MCLVGHSSSSELTLKQMSFIDPSARRCFWTFRLPEKQTQRLESQALKVDGVQTKTYAIVDSTHLTFSDPSRDANSYQEYRFTKPVSLVDDLANYHT